MKNFDLDKLERKTPYKIPDNFFEDMQTNVLKKTVNQEKKSAKVFKLHFSAVTSIAATIVLLFGFAFLWKTNQTDMVTTSHIDSIESVDLKPNEIPNTDKNNAVSASEPTQKSDAASQSQNITEKNIAISNDDNSIKTESKSTDLNYEQLLNSLSDEELKELSKNTDQDLYLELFN